MMTKLKTRSWHLLTRAVNKFVPDRFVLNLKNHLNLVRRMDYSRHDIYLSVDTSIEYEIRLHSAKKEPETVAWIEELLGQGDVMYDIGANVGAYSLIASKFTDGLARIYAFEPAFTTFPNLCRNILLNRCAGSVIPLNLALSESTRIDNFNYLDLDSGSSCHAYGTNVLFSGESFEPMFTQPIISYTVDDLVETFGLEVPSLIKIDVDGNEPAILTGAMQTLRRKELRSVLVEVNEKLPENTSSIVDVLTASGLELRSRHRNQWDDDSENTPFSMSCNYIFVRKQ